MIRIYGLRPWKRIVNVVMYSLPLLAFIFIGDFRTKLTEVESLIFLIPYILVFFLIRKALIFNIIIFEDKTGKLYLRRFFKTEQMRSDSELEVNKIPVVSDLYNIYKLKYLNKIYVFYQDHDLSIREHLASKDNSMLIEKELKKKLSYESN